jgi:hypothetical protein
MENVFIIMTVALLAAAVATFVAIAREVSSYLSVEHRYALSHVLEASSFRQLRAGDGAVGQAWKSHVEFFPQSRKRLLFGVLVTLAALSVFFYPVWIAMH